MTDVEVRLTDVFRTTFGDESLVLKDAMTADDVAAWDSVSHIQLIFAIEEEFDIKFSMRDLEAIEDVGSLVSTVRRHLGR
jgi:acyl carrier protein